MDDKELSSHLQKNGLDNVTFWKQKLEEKLGVTSKAALDLLVGDRASYCELEKEAKFPVEKKALQKLFKVDEKGQSEKKLKKKAEKKEQAREKSEAEKEELRKKEERAQALLKELGKARSEGKDRHDERIQKLESEIRGALDIAPSAWISEDKTLDELIKKLEARHESSAQVQARESLDDGMLLQNGRVLNGVLLTKKLEEQLQERSRLLEVPEKVVITGAAQADNQIMQFSSSQQESLYKKTVDILGHGKAMSSSFSYGGFSVGVGVSQSDRSEEEKTHQTNTKVMYSSTVKYSTLQVASYSFENKDLKLSSDAKADLKKVLKKFRIEGESSAGVQEECKRFFDAYGSHVYKGPFQFGGSFWWTCSSTGFSSEDTETVKSMQSEAISATAGISFAGFGVSTEVSMDKVKASYEGKCTKNTLASTNLQVKLAGGPPEATELSLWKSGLVANNSTWIVTDRGKKLIPVWDIIGKNHEREFGEIKGVLRSTWEKMSGLQAEEELSSILKYDPDTVLDEVAEWNQNEDISPRQIKDYLEHLSRVKEDIINKTRSPRIWITEYLSASPLQDFLESVMDSKLEPYFERSKSLLEELAPLELLSQLDSRAFPNIEEVSNWLYKPGELTTYCTMQRDIVDFESFDNFLQKTIENASTAQLKDDSPLLELSAKSSEILARDISKGILFLRFYFPRSYEDIFINIMMFRYQSSRCGDVVTVKPDAITLNSLKSLQECFSKERKEFVCHLKKKHPIHLQAYLFNLAVKLHFDVEKHQIQKLLQQIVGTMKEYQLSIEKELSEMLNEYIRGTLLLAQLERNLQSLMNNQYVVKQSQPAPSKNKSRSLKSALLTPTHQLGVQTRDQSSLLEENPKIKDLFENLGISKLYPKRMQLKDALCIRPESLKLSLNEADTSDPKQLPYLVMHKLMSYDYLCRSDLLKGNQSDSCSDDSESDDYEYSDDDNDDATSDKKNPTGNSSAGIHPVDSLLALILCSDDFLCQDLLSRLAKCQLAVPFILPDPFTKQLSIPLWAMQSIVKEWKCIQQTGTGSKVVQRTHPVVEYGMPIVSFIRFGKPQKRGQSKSKILNEVISESHYDHFFHRDSPGGQRDLLLGEGLVDMCWYLPAGKPADAFPDAVTFLNLHGDARQHPDQCKFLSQISSMCFVLLNEEDLMFDEQTMEALKKFSTAPGGVTLLNDVEQRPKKNIKG